MRRPLRRAPARDRRGVLILVVLSLLILFVVIAVMFVVVASRARAVARAYSDVGRTGDTPQELVYGIALDLIRGSLNPHSPFRSTSLLEDYYGQWAEVKNSQTFIGSLRGTVAQVVNPAPANGKGGFVDIVANFSFPNPTPSPSSVKDAYSGCVLTFISGAAKGLSTRIVEYWPQGALTGVQGYKFRLFVLRNEYGNDLATAIAPQAVFLINGRPFSGTGVGYQADTAQGAGRVNAMSNGRPIALLPNPAFFVPDQTSKYGSDPAGPGGANEDYDGPDFQNPFLAYYDRPNPIVPNENNPGRTIKPSFHDPALLRYWMSQQSSGQMPPDLYRKILFRPAYPDHPIFNETTNKPLSDRLRFLQGLDLGPWDIDNDGDGLPDSIWIDAGYPVQMTKQGRLYKPLVAVLILDMDGRSNVNAHGQLAGQPAADRPIPSPTSSGMTLAGGASNVTLPRGSGYGPAEIRLDRVLQSTSAAVMQSRYGVDGKPGVQNLNDPFSAIKLFGLGPSNPDKWPPDPIAPFGPVSNYGTPPDMSGRVAVALDPHGQPVWDKNPDNLGNAWSNERLDNPYELDLSRYSARALPNAQNNGPFDAPYSIAELERVLRPNDIDSGLLPIRLLQLTSADLSANAGRRNEFTTDSWDYPGPSMVASPGMRAHLGNGTVPGQMTSVADIVHARLSPTYSQPDQLAKAIDNLLAPEVRRGLRFDLNRPFGDGQDGDPSNPTSRDGIVDNAQEGMQQGVDKLNYASQPFNGPADVPFDAINGQDFNNDGKGDYSDRYMYDSRQLFARYLYVMMMLCTDDTFKFPLSIIPSAPMQAPKWGRANAELDANANQNELQELKAKRLAQWAINVVDFRDADNIMTPFPFDTNPFNGWDPSGQEGGIVWGCEMPVALLMETLAFHDKRLKDTAHDDGPDKKRDDNNDGTGDEDPDLDQPVIPRGSAFVEVMALFDPNVTVQSGDLFTYDPTNKKWRLDLTKMAPGPNPKPVWRLAVSEFHTKAAADNGHQDPVSDIVSEHPDTVSLQPIVDGETAATSPWNFSLLRTPVDTHQVKIERMVWFGATAPTGIDADRTYFALSNTAQLEGFQYAVVGPGGAGAGDRTNATVKGIMVGWNDVDDPAKTQQIRLNTPVAFSGTANDTTANIKPSIGIQVASPAGRIKTSDLMLPWGQGDRVGFSISEPLFSDAKYYPKPSEQDPNTTLTEAYGLDSDNNKKFRDKPLDYEPSMPLEERDMLKTGTYNNVRTVFLQRLADPTLPFNQQTNPYITVDWMPFDLTVFNGQDRYQQGNQLPEDQWDPKDPTPDTNPPVHFATRERGKKSAANTDYNVWTPVSEAPEDTEPTGPAEDYFRHKLVHSLGHLNKTYGNPSAAAPGPSGNAFLGAPAKPFPWIRWANRPFVNALELMEVPASTPSRLGLEFNYAVPSGAQQTEQPYAQTPNQDPSKRQFNHLLNFFRASDVNNTTLGGDFYRIFEFVHVPSPFVGTETMLDPTTFQTPSSGAPVAGTENFRAPFNWMSNYRDPGKVNLNTLNSVDVWNALMGVAPNGTARPSFLELRGIRRGAGALLANQFSTSPITSPSQLPTIMPNVFRSPTAGDMVPDLPGSAAQQGALKRKGVDVTLLRAASGNNAAPLFANPPNNPQQKPDYAQPDRNAAFRYRDLERLANLTTTRSNVYAIWITVGYFEVFPNGTYNTNGKGVDAGHPDGYEIGAELGTDTGEINRHRGFFILDRTIPVGFERGYNHNVDRAILVKRFIE